MVWPNVFLWTLFFVIPGYKVCHPEWKANIRGQEIKMKRCEKYADNRMAVKWLLRWNWIPSQGGCFCSLSHFLLLFFQINSFCIDCYDLRGGPQCRRGCRSKWIKRICCKGSWKWRWEEGRWSGRGQEGRQGWVNGMCWQGVEGGCWPEGGKQVGRWAQGKHKEKVTVNRSQERRGRCAKPDTERQGSTGDRVSCLSSSQWGARKRCEDGGTKADRNQIIRSLNPCQLLIIWCTPIQLTEKKKEWA